MKNSLRTERKKRKITQEQLANLVGVSRQSINAIERGKYTPSTVLSMKISEIFNTSVNKLFELEPVDYEKSN
ncbi:putative transcriptional regulator [Roseivirga pacifica]|uniref:Putative transcriptional regulator n=1 Tax=Roseivirga pacifica TaxID=1267423 RepID=A0A1I0MWG8_9BACT|nr:helix-turn-helix transcriptional regulator [Roseivirga pacifica]MCO6359242.1 helix-turn-helix domain-containing protein [Roseivirga pacifica]MCO6365122.1 helix-turn-helix domain-containing protein [Roseivirga pacifica]MCO6372148.1 helix-turn-helix domain-containing protein [Roseivirga pacifica]MCO6375741.1 helix-turn-helix domain-containing protein [Roseivirga pacifica]MCO6379526.1 helix-turn-helix domain-containing protein [Roseivirga pacifica]